MRSLVFIALLGLALAVPVPHAQPEYEDNALFDSHYDYEQDEDCIETQPAYHSSDEIYDHSPTEYNQDDCEGEEIEVEDFINIQIKPDQEDFEPANVDDNVVHMKKFDQEPMKSEDLSIGNSDYSSATELDSFYDEECEEDDPQTTEVPVTMEPTTEPADYAGDCVGDQYEEIDEEEYENYEDLDLEEINKKVLAEIEPAYDSRDLILDMSDDEFVEEENCEY